MKRNTIIGQLLRLPQLLIVPMTLILVSFAKKSAELVESIYSTGFYPIVRDVISKFTRIVPFSLAEISVYSCAILIAAFLFIKLIRLITLKKGALLGLVSFVITIALTAGYLLSAFYLLWGLNYYRLPAADKLDLPSREYSTAELESLCVELARNANELREQLDEDEDGVFTVSMSELRSSVVEAYKNFGTQKPSFKADVPTVKSIMLSETFSQLGITGIYVFLTEEPNINVNEPCLYLPHAAAHETAHFLGYAAEEDANFIAFLVCIASDSASLTYSGYVHALTHCGNALAKVDRDAYSRVYSTYTEGLKRDFRNYSEHYHKYADTEIMQASENLNDSYLKANDQEKGIASYEEDVALILRYYDSIGFFG